MNGMLKGSRVRVHRIGAAGPMRGTVVSMTRETFTLVFPDRSTRTFSFAWTNVEVL